MTATLNFSEVFYQKAQEYGIGQTVSIIALPAWYPFFFKSLIQKTQVFHPEVKLPDLAIRNVRDLGKFYCGITGTARCQPLIPLCFMLQNTAVDQLTKEGKKLTVYEELGISFLAGGSTAFFANPLEVVVISLNELRKENPKASINEAIHRVNALAGKKGFYSGFNPMFVRNGVVGITYITCYEKISDALQKMLPGQGITQLALSKILGSGMTASLLVAASTPMDLVAALHQSDPARKKYTTSFNTFQNVFNQKSFRGICTGVKPRGIAATIEILLVNEFRSFFTNHFASKQTQSS